MLLLRAPARPMYCLTVQSIGRRGLRLCVDRIHVHRLLLSLINTSRAHDIHHSLLPDHHLLTRLEVHRGSSLISSMGVHRCTSSRRGSHRPPGLHSVRDLLTYLPIYYIYVYRSDLFHNIGGAAHDTSSGSGWFSDVEINPDDYVSQTVYGGMFVTPPPQPTQDTQQQQDDQGYQVPLRHRQPPQVMYSPSPFQHPLPPRRRVGRTRRSTQD